MQADSNVKKLKRFNTLSILHHQIAVNTNFGQIARVAMRELIDIFTCDCCAIMQISGGTFTILTEKNFSNIYGTANFVDTIPSIAYVAATGHSLYTGKIPAHLQNGTVIVQAESNSILCTPVAIKDTLFGVIYIASRHINNFTKEDSDYVFIVARELSKALKNSFPFDRTDSQCPSVKAFKPLTQRRFDRDIIAQIASAEWERKPLSLLIIDTGGLLENTFTPVNGRLANSENSLVKMLITNLRPLDNIYRYDHRDLAILLPETTKNNALRIAERLKSVLKTGVSEKNTASSAALPVQIGVSSFPVDADYRDGLIRKAYHHHYENAR